MCFAAASPADTTPAGTTRTYRDSHRGTVKAEEYDRGFAPGASAKWLAWETERRLLDRVLERHVERPVRGAVDFACGTGRVLGYLTERVPRCTGVDVSPEMLAIAARRCPGATIVRADVTCGEVVRPDHPVDLVTAFRFFLNAEPELRRQALGWIRGQLADGGVLAANFHLNPHSARGTYLRARGLRGQPMMSLPEAERLLTGAGLRVRARYGYEYLPYRRDGERVRLPRLRRLTDRALAARPRLAPVAGSFLLVAAADGGR